jgi:DNA-binding response OmpR family regulator
MQKILLVEDDEILASGIEFALKKELFYVDWAKNLSEAESLMSSSNFDLIILDIMLPDGNGFDFCIDIRLHSKNPIIFLTACDEEVSIVHGLDIGADDYITKPFRLRELISRIRAVLRRTISDTETTKNLTDTSIIKSNNITINLLEGNLYKNGVTLSLTPIEYKLTAILIQNPQIALSRNVLLEKLWDINDEFIDDNTISVHIRRLREKLEDDPSNPKYIVTVWGIGYKWNTTAC